MPLRVVVRWWVSRVLAVVVLGCAVLLGVFISGAAAGDVALGVATTETSGATTQTTPGPAPTPVPDPDPAPPPAPTPPPAPASLPPASQPASPAMSSAAKKKEPIPRKRRRPDEPPPRASHPLRAMPHWAVSSGVPERPTGAVSVLSPETAADSQPSVSARVVVLAAGLLAVALVAVLLAFEFMIPALARLPVSDDTRLQLVALVAALPIVLAIGFLIAA